MKNKLVVYTALLGDYDNLIEPKEKYEGCDFICFTDQKHLTSDIWEIRLIEECDLPPNMMNIITPIPPINRIGNIGMIGYGEIEWKK